MGLVAVSETIEIPHDPDGATMDLAGVSWMTIKIAKKKKQTEGIESAHEVGAELMKVFQGGGDSDAAEKLEAAKKELAAEEEADPWAPKNFDMGTMLEAGIKGWSWPDKCNGKTIGQLDLTSAEWALGVIIEKSKPMTEGEKKVS